MRTVTGTGGASAAGALALGLVIVTTAAAADTKLKAGWTPKEIREALHRSTKLSFRKLMLNKEYDSFRQAHPELAWLEDAPDTPVSVNPSAECFEFFVVGASAGRSQFCFGGTHSVTRAVGRT